MMVVVEELKRDPPHQSVAENVDTSTSYQGSRSGRVQQQQQKELCEALFRPVGRKISLTQPPTVDHVIGMEGSVVRATDVEEK